MLGVAAGAEGEAVDCAPSVGTGPKCLRNGLLLGLSVVAAGTGELSGVGGVDICTVGGCGEGEAGLDCVEGARTNSSPVLPWVGVVLPTVSGSSSSEDDSSSSCCRRIRRLWCAKKKVSIPYELKA